jgi:hypothetical protein
LDKLLKAAYEGVVRVSFNHYRTGESMVRDVSLKASPIFIKQRSDSSVIAFYDVVHTRWETIDVNTITDWEIIK